MLIRVVPVVRKALRVNIEKVKVNGGEETEEEEKFKYLRVMINVDGGMGEEVIQWVQKRRKIWRRQGKIWKENTNKRALYKRVVIPAVVYGSETWSLSVQKRIKSGV